MAQRFAQPVALDSPANAAAFDSVMMRLDDAPLRNSSKGKAIWRIDRLNALRPGLRCGRGLPLWHNGSDHVIKRWPCGTLQRCTGLIPSCSVFDFALQILVLDNFGFKDQRCICAQAP